VLSEERATIPQIFLAGELLSPHKDSEMRKQQNRTGEGYPKKPETRHFPGLLVVLLTAHVNKNGAQKEASLAKKRKGSYQPTSLLTRIVEIRKGYSFRRQK
jgi:hypothetical protein